MTSNNGGSTGASLLKHPNKSEIDERLLAGESVESVAAWVKQRFGRQPKLQVGKMTLQAYRKNYLNLDGDVLAELKKERSVKISEDRKRRAVEVAHSSENYQVAKAEYVQGLALQISNTNQRLEECYLNLQKHLGIMEGEKTHHLNEKVILEQIRLMKDILKDAFDMEQTLKDGEQTNINIDVGRIVQQMQLLKMAVRETISEVCPEVWPVFMDKLKEKLQAAHISEMSESGNDEIDSEGQVNINIKA